ncbi:VOC family protein [Subtercola sp. YIM 133946]|uniref:VOC family protein n=1 Tax=Subtercola sp. YIM 133946 TaxID=3118909 RepID=UPI002F943AE0
MNLVSVRIITDNVAALAAFYERLTGGTVVHLTDDFAEVRTPSATIAVGSTRTVALFGAGSAEPGANRSLIVEFLVDDVDAVYERLAGWVTTFVNRPTTLPWGNRSLLLRDTDGTLVNLFTPVSPDAIQRFAETPR